MTAAKQVTDPTTHRSVDGCCIQMDRADIGYMAFDAFSRTCGVFLRVQGVHTSVSGRRGMTSALGTALVPNRKRGPRRRVARCALYLISRARWFVSMLRDNRRIMALHTLVTPISRSDIGSRVYRIYVM